MNKENSTKEIQYIRNFLMGLGVLLTLYSCGRKQFATNQSQIATTTTTRSTTTNFSCSKFTVVRPQVDLLFLWDNSSSTTFINPQTKASLNNIITQVSSRFDYHIVMSPLIGSGNTGSYFITNQDGLNPGTGLSKITTDQIPTALDTFPKINYTAENGLGRVTELLAANISNGVFRSGAYTLVVIMSNQDDNSYIQTVDNGYDRNIYINAKTEEILCLRGNHSGTCTGSSINSQMMRLITIAPLDPNLCSNSGINQYKINYVYKALSNKIYTAPYTNSNPTPNDQLVSPVDAIDICRENYSTIFNGVNSAIQDIILKHSYRYWPVASSSKSIDESTITVTNELGQSFQEISSSITITKDLTGKNDRDQFNQPVSGFRFLANSQTKDTRFLPTNGEAYSGYLVELFGNAKVTYPSCLRISYKAPLQYFGYIKLNAKPLESSITLKVNGFTIPQSSINGWQLIKDSSGDPLYKTNQNIRIKSPTNRAAGTPADNQTGYFLEVFGPAVYKNGDDIDVTFDPLGSN